MKARMLKYNLQFFADGESGTGSENPDQAGEGEGAGTTGEGTGKTTEGESDKTEKTFTQKQVTSMMTREKKQGKEAAYRELGVDPNDSKMVKMVKAFIDSQKTEEELNAEANAEQAAKVAQAEHRAMVAEAKAEAMKAGAKSDFVDDVVALAMTKVDEKTDIDSVIGDLKTKYPMWFGGEESGDDEKATGKKGTGSSVGNGSGSGTGKGGNEKNLGARLAASRNAVQAGGKERKSFWS